MQEETRDAMLRERVNAGTPVVGVLGGMGPAATADFYRKIVAATPAARDQDHLRTMIWSDPSIPDRAKAFLNGGESPVAALLAGAQLLQRAGADYIAVPCNTAHLFLPPVRKAVSIPVLDMVDATVSELSQHMETGARVAILGTAATLSSGIYRDRLRAAGLRPIEPTAAEQQSVVLAIAAVKAGQEAEAATRIAPVIDALVARGASTIVAGCTELPIACDRLSDAPPLTDPTAALARACVARAGRIALAA